MLLLLLLLLLLPSFLPSAMLAAASGSAVVTNTNPTTRSLAVDSQRLLGAFDEICYEGRVLCQTDPGCAACAEHLLQTYNIVWYRDYSPDDECDRILQDFDDPGPCQSFVFCDAFNTCVWNDHIADNLLPETVDCDALEECKWPGMVSGFLGDGSCQDAITGCYNTEICGYDGGDCCSDTCTQEGKSFCGNDGYACRDPKSEDCDPSLTKDCPGNNSPIAPLECGPKQTKYRLTLYGSVDEGWINDRLIIFEKRDPSRIVFNGTLERYPQQTTRICLSHNVIYHSVMSGGFWGTETSWDIRQDRAGPSIIVTGGMPTTCEFFTSNRDQYCFDGSSEDYKKHPGYASYNDLLPCLQSKCSDYLRKWSEDEPWSSGDYARNDEHAIVHCAIHKCGNYSNSGQAISLPVQAELPVRSEHTNPSPQTMRPSALTLKRCGAILFFVLLIFTALVVHRNRPSSSGRYLLANKADLAGSIEIEMT